MKKLNGKKLFYGILSIDHLALHIAYVKKVWPHENIPTTQLISNKVIIIYNRDSILTESNRKLKGWKQSV